MSYTINQYTATNNNFIEDESGANIGVEFQQDGDMLRCILLNFPIFDLSNRTATSNFITQFKNASGVWKTLGDGNFSKTVSDKSGYVYIIPELFGQTESQPYTDPNADPLVLKDGLLTEAQFFINTIVSNKYGAPVDMKSFCVAAIVRNFSLT